VVARAWGTGITHGASFSGSSLRSAASRAVKSPGCAGRSNTMKRMFRQAGSFGTWSRTVDTVSSKRPLPAHSSPSIGTAGSAAVNQSGAATRSPPRVQSCVPSQ
jgi:hypothetical protein